MSNTTTEPDIVLQNAPEPLTFEELVNLSRKHAQDATALTQARAADPELTAAVAALHAAQSRVTALDMPYGTALQRLTDADDAVRAQILTAWPDQSRKTINGEGWFAQRRVTKRINVTSPLHAITHLAEHHILDKTLKSVTWDQTALKRADELGMLDGKAFYEHEEKTILALTWQDIAPQEAA